MKKRDTMEIREEWLMEVLDTLEMLEDKAETNGESKVMYEMIRTLKDNLEIGEQGGRALFFLIFGRRDDHRSAPNFYYTTLRRYLSSTF